MMEAQKFHEKRLVRASVLAGIFNLTEESILRLARDGVLPCVRLGRSVRFDLQEVRQLFEKKLSRPVGVGGR